MLNNPLSIITQFILQWGIEHEANQFLGHKFPIPVAKIEGLPSMGLHKLNTLEEHGLHFSKAQLSRIKSIKNLEYWEEIPLYFHLKNIKKEINEALLYMFLNPNNFELIHYVPTPLSMLNLQCTNKRYISLMLEPNFTFEGKNVWEFLLHDLSHFARFMENRECQLGQVGFAKFIKTMLEQNLLENLPKSNKGFKEEFEYIYSDMNAYPVHALKAFKGVLKKHLSEVDFNYYFKNTLNYFFKEQPKLQTAYNNLNTPNFNLNDEILINDYFNSYNA
ncbi:MAG: hypothetical protein U0T83_06860 [Bacteriovoracaceae bacterium]